MSPFAVSLLFCLIAAISAAAAAEGAKELHVASNCTNVSVTTPCHNLSYYLRNPSQYLTSDTILTFQEGTHLLEEPVIISGVSNLTLRGRGQIQDGYHWTVRESTVKINCRDTESGFMFINSSVHIEVITFTNCGMPVGPDRLRPHFEPFFDGAYKINYNFERYLDLHASLIVMDSDSVSLEQVSIQNCSGFCVFSLDTYFFNLSQVYIAHTSPQEYTQLGCCDYETQSSLKCTGGNVILFYLEGSACSADVNNSFSLSIADSVLSYGAGFFNNTDSEMIMSAITLVDLLPSQLNVLLHSVLLYENTGGNFGALTTYTSATFDNVTSMGANMHICKASRPTVAFKVSITNELRCPPKLIPEISPLSETFVYLNVTNSNFLGNLAIDSAGIDIDTSLIVPFLRTYAIYYVVISNSVFSRNVASFGSCIGIGGLVPISVSFVHFSLINVTFDENLFDPTYLSYDPRTLTNPYRGVPPSCLAFGNTILASFTNVTISNHNSLGIYAYNTRMIMNEENELRNNSGVQGGGLMLLGTSAFVLSSSVLRFVDNTAERGAAIFISPPLVSSVEYPFCQYQVEGEVNSSQLLDSSIYFSGNKASETGDIIYGGDVDGCLLYTDFGVSESSIEFDELFDYDDDDIKRGYAISSDAIRACFCFNGTTRCDVHQLMLDPVYPGQMFTFTIATVGDLNGYTTGRVNITGFSELVHINVPRCFNVSLSSNGLVVGSNASFSLSVDDTFDRDDAVTLSIVLPVIDCPDGFSISDSSSSCECGEAIASLTDGVVCSIESQSIYHQSDAWIGYSDADNCILVADHCPFDYCVNSNVSFSINEGQFDPQCALDRSGILCGGCGNLSLMLGSNKCGHCSDSTISLLLLFVAAGIALVVLLIGLNLTVSVGTINGLIFYANIIKVNQPIFFPNGPIPFLSQFIAWVNLDLGIEICFYDGMTPIDKIWLQFVFPVYIWVIIGAIIIVCRYSTKLSSLVSYNAVPVLATLLLLSYVKIIRTYILALKPSSIHCGVDRTLSVWAVDGNIAYFGTSHIVLFLFSLLVLLVTVIPYTLFVVSIPLLERYPGACGMLWLGYLKPVSDAYCGPFKDKYRFWAGLLIVVRLIIANTVPFLSQTERLLIIVFFVSFLLFFFTNTGGPYKAWYLNLLEVWFFVHLICTAALSLANVAVIGTKVSVSLAFISFVFILIGHVIARLHDRGTFSCLTKKVATIQAKQPTMTVIKAPSMDDLPRFRESLLGYIDEDNTDS